jgi:hypothetical protein
VYQGIFNVLNLKGKRKSALSAFAFAAGRIPWIENQNVSWRDEPSLSVAMNPFWKNLSLFLIPFFKPIRVQSSATLSSQEKMLEISGTTELRLLGLSLKTYKTDLQLSRDSGIIQITLDCDGKNLLKAKHIEHKESNDVQENPDLDS